MSIPDEFEGMFEESSSDGRWIGELAVVLIWCLAMGILAIVVPRVEATFADFGLDLGWKTRLVFRASDFWVLAGIGIVALVVANHLVLGRISRRKGGGEMARVWSKAMLILAMIAVGFEVAAVIEPLTCIMTRMAHATGHQPRCEDSRPPENGAFFRAAWTL